MSLENQIVSALKEAMKSKDALALQALRAIKSELLLLKSDGSGEAITEAKEIAVLSRMVKQRKDAAQQFQDNNRPELAEKELKEVEVIQQFLPQQLTQEEVQAKIKEIIAQTGAASPKDIGKVMGVASKELAGKAEGKLIADIAKELLQP